MKRSALVSNDLEDQKLVTLANATKMRSGATAAAALRDNTGRTYVAIPVTVSDFVIDALQAVLVVAKASQISGIEAVVVVGLEPSKSSIALVRAVTEGALVFWSQSENGLLSR